MYEYDQSNHLQQLAFGYKTSLISILDLNYQGQWLTLNVFCVHHSHDSDL